MSDNTLDGEKDAEKIKENLWSNVLREKGKACFETRGITRMTDEWVSETEIDAPFARREAANAEEKNRECKKGGSIT